MGEEAKTAPDPALGSLAHRAGVEDHHIGVFRLVGFSQSIAKKSRLERVAFGDVHLAPIGLNEKGFLQHARAAFKVLYMSMAMVITPTPPGTGVIALHFGATSSKATSPTIR